MSASDGRLTLSGAVLRGEHDRLLRKLAKVRGVREVDDGLEVHQSAGNLASRPVQGTWGPRIMQLGLKIIF